MLFNNKLNKSIKNTGKKSKKCILTAALLEINCNKNRHFAHLLTYSEHCHSTQCPEINITDIFDCNYQILIIFDNISGTTGNQTTNQFSTKPTVCFCTTWGNKIIESTKYCIFILFCLFGFSQVVQKQTSGDMETKTVT